MSWFKKLFQIFKSEEDEYIENIPPENKENGRDVDAKILYQYPKGQFRFPLIPDEEAREKRPPRSVEKKTYEKAPSEPTKSRRTSIPIKTEPRHSKEKVTETRTGRVQKTSNRPFRPTEIPSPIYGFEKPSRKSAPVEFELGTFSSKEKAQSSAVNIDQVNKTRSQESSLTKEKVVEITKQASAVDEEKDNSVKIDIEENKIELQADLESRDSSPVFPTKVENELKESRQESEIEVAALTAQTHAEVQKDDGFLFETNQDTEHGIKEPLLEKERSGDLIREKLEQAFPELGMMNDAQAFEIDEEKEVGSVLEQEQEPGSETESALELNTELESELESEPEPEQEPASEFEIESEPETDLALELVPELEPGQGLEQELEHETTTEFQPEQELEPEPEPEPEPKRRSHIPFNVIMLKEDRKKLEQRNFARKEIEKPILETSASVEEVEVEEEIPEEEYYVHPSLDLLKPPVFKSVDKEWLELQEHQLNDTLFNFNVRASVANVTQGPSVTRFEVRPEPGVKVNKITNLADDIKLSLAAKDIRMEAPIPGTHMIGIEVPNEKSRPVLISEILTSEEFSASQSPLTAVLGLDISGKPIVTDLRKMPHGLIAGATGSGKSVCINSILVSLLYKANPNDVKLLLIDPKMVELAPYNQIPHLVSPVITDVKAATAALKWAVDEMERRYELFAHAGVREITRYNEIAEQEKNYSVKLPYIVIVIDELADLMMMSPADVEEAICRIAQKARACGIHLIIATQRPSVDVITGLIKANVPTRIAFSVSSQIDSRTIIDISGAERLLGRGDMLFLENGSSKPVRLQGTFVSDEEIDSIVAHVRREQSPQYLFEQEELLKKATVIEEEDELFYEACEYIIEQGGASTSSLQRRFKIGYNRAARLIDMMEEQGLISEAKGSKPRDVLMTESELESMHGES